MAASPSCDPTRTHSSPGDSLHTPDGARSRVEHPSVLEALVRHRGRRYVLLFSPDSAVLWGKPSLLVPETHPRRESPPGARFAVQPAGAVQSIAAPPPLSTPPTTSPPSPPPSPSPPPTPTPTRRLHRPGTYPSHPHRRRRRRHRQRCRRLRRRRRHPRHLRPRHPLHRPRRHCCRHCRRRLLPDEPFTALADLALYRSVATTGRPMAMAAMHAAVPAGAPAAESAGAAAARVTTALEVPGQHRQRWRRRWFTRRGWRWQGRRLQRRLRPRLNGNVYDRSTGDPSGKRHGPYANASNGCATPLA